MSKLIDSRIPTSFDAARALADASRSGEKRLSPNTVVRRNYFAGSCCTGMEVVLYGTPVVTFYADGTLGLRTGGHVTVTTRARMNAALRGLGLVVSIEDGRFTLRQAGSKPFAAFAEEALLVLDAGLVPAVYPSRVAFEAMREAGALAA